VPAVEAIITSLVLNGNLGQVTDDVLHLSVGMASLRAAKIVEPADLVKEVVDNSDDDDNTNGVTPNNDDSDDARMSILGKKTSMIGWVTLLTSSSGKPSKDTEEGREDVDTKDSSNKLPRGPGFTATGDEDKPILSERDFQEEYTLDGTEVLNDTTVWQEHRATNDPGSEGEKYTEDD